ncbi:coronin-2B [Pleuronectes platessa]|uniref:coronin-2B n=1 Tax=Pleuronectes platessa TaxID=8262 RepID=UPI00232A25E7|nr:coronin-2B [Pleuronectes platessa]
MPGTEMSWRSSFRCPRLRHVFVKQASRELSYTGLPITRCVHDNHHCSANPCFLAVVTECAGGGSFLVLPIHHTGRVDPQHPRVCGHSGRVLDVRWNPFDDHCIASCSEDFTVKIWDIPVCGVQQNLTKARKTLIGHSRRVGLIEWHPTAENLLLSSAYDYKVLLWDVSQAGAVIRLPVRVVLMPVLHRYPSEALLLSVSFNSDGSRLAVSSKDRRVRVLDPRTGKILQVSRNKSHRASKVLYLRGLKMLLSTGSSPWNHRQIVLWDPDDLSQPLYEEDLDGSAGVLFPFYDPDTHMLYLAGKGDGNIRFYELSAEKPFISFLSEFRSLLPHKGLGVMPKRGLDVSLCEVFRFYRLIAVKDLVEPLSLIVPRKQSGVFHEDLYPMTAGNQAAMTAQEWLSGIDRGPVLMSLKPATRVANPYPETPAEKGVARQLSSLRFQTGPDEEAFLQEQLAYQDAKYPRDLSDLSGWQPDETQIPLWMYCCTPHCLEPAERPPPTTESEARMNQIHQRTSTFPSQSPEPFCSCFQLLQTFYRQQDEIRGLRDGVDQRDVRIAELELEIRNTRNNMRATF